jgi:hypothetical protein
VHATLGWRLPVAVLGRLGCINVLLGVFNLLPAVPLDGGRVLQAAPWWRTGDQEQAQRAAARGGQIIGMARALVGWSAFVRGTSGGLWLMVVALFLAGAAAAERRWAQPALTLRGVPVAQAMSSPVATGPDWLTLDRFLSDVAARTRHSVLPLLDFEGRPQRGRPRRLTTVPSGRRQTLPVRDLATPVSQCTLAAPDEPLTAVLARLGAGGVLPVLVMEGGHLDGIITAHDIQRLYQRNAARKNRGTTAPGATRAAKGLPRNAREVK